MIFLDPGWGLGDEMNTHHQEFLDTVPKLRIPPFETPHSGKPFSSLAGMAINPD